MIARLWHGCVPASKAGAYRDYLHRTGISDYQRTPGNRGVFVMRRDEGEVTHYLVMTLWESWDSIRAFAGDDISRSRYYGEDPDYLLELEPLVTHYEVVDAPQLG